jgi:signal transduction histidine kinase
MFDRLEDAFLRLRRFTGDVSHELRTPLAVLLGEGELALRKERNPEEYQTALKTIIKEAKHMQSMVEDLLLLARAESQAVAMSWQVVKTEAFVSDLVQSVKPVYSKKEVTLDVQLETSLKEFTANVGFLTIALKNILLNAAKHSAPHQKVNLIVGTQGFVPMFTILDQGEGITSESLPYIFDPFFRADTARNRASGGSGIGLSLALALVKLHGGTIDVESQPGKGAAFKVSWSPPESL